VHCSTSDRNTEYTYCENCGSINCPTHIKTERLEGRPVCTGCAVTERFALKTKYFYNEDNRAEFRAQYEAMPVYERVRENPWLVVGIVIVSFIVVLLGLSELGLV
jgi:restriction endonuclease Mrr